MLVLSRRPDEKILFPNLGVTIQVLRVQGNVVRLGIDAPPELRVLRAELQDKSSAQPKLNKHALANIQNKAQLQAHLLQRKLECGAAGGDEDGLHRLLESLESLEQELAPPKRAQPLCKTLVVDDDTNERELLAGLLAMHDCECAVAEDGEAAMGYLETHKPDFVLLDMWMPRCDGRETIRRIRTDQRLAGLKVFGISGASMEEVGVQQGQDGVDAWFSKPLDPRLLWKTMQGFLHV